jgi:glycerol-3-phosphate dehydrogenase (NAD(P)+)
MIAVVGAGAMGAAVATHLVRGGHQVVLFATDRDEAAVRAWRNGDRHPGLGIVLHPGVVIQYLADSPTTLGEADMIVVAVSSPGLGPVLSTAAVTCAPDAVWVLATKGWQEETYLTPSELAASILGPGTAVVTLAGPGLATELEAGLPTALLCASRNANARRRVAQTLMAPSIFAVTTSDVAGAEVASAYKNVAAIAVGIAEGLSKRFTSNAGRQTFANARAAMFAQGMLDMVSLATARGGRSATVLGLAGVGDLYVTCVGGRNGRFGRLLGSGSTTEQALRSINSTVEGVANTRVALELGQRYSVDLRTARAVDLALHHHLIDGRGTQEIRDLFSATMRPQYTFPYR